MGGGPGGFGHRDRSCACATSPRSAPVEVVQWVPRWRVDSSAREHPLRGIRYRSTSPVAASMTTLASS